MTHTECPAPPAPPVDQLSPSPELEQSASPPQRQIRSRKRTSFAVFGALAAVGAGMAAAPSIRSGLLAPAATAYETAPVEASPFRMTIEAKGTINSVKNATVVSEVRGFSTIISLIPAGTMVEDPVKSLVTGTVTAVRTPENEPWEIVVTDPLGRPFSHTTDRIGEYSRVVVSQGNKVRRGEILAGDVVCELDRSELLDNEKELRIQVTKAQAAFESAGKNVEIRIAKNESALAAAEMKADLAKLDLEKFTSAEFPQQQEKMQGQLEENRQALNRAKESLQYTQRLAQKGYKDFNDVEAARFKVLDAELKFKNVEGELKLLEGFSHDRSALKLREEAVNSARNVVRVRLSNEAVLSQYDAILASRERSLLITRDRWERVVRQLKACTLVAPQAGQVVYAENRYSSSSRLIEEGARVREQQAVVYIPDMRHMKLDARIHESMIGRIRPGLPAEIRVDAVPGVIFQSRLTEISSVPLPGRFPNFNIKEYAVDVTIDSASVSLDRLHSGMAGSAQIIVEHSNENLPQIPLRSVVATDSEKFVWVSTARGVERRIVEVGPSNEEAFVVTGGVEPGEEVVLNPRDHFVAEIDELEQAAAAAVLDDWYDTRPIDKASVQVASSPVEEEPENAESQQASRPSQTQDAACTEVGGGG